MTTITTISGSVQSHLPCLHEKMGSDDHIQIVPDHHPLTKSEIKELLQRAANPSISCVSLASIQVRLLQGIPGYTCPRPYEGLVAEKEMLISSLFVKEYEHPTDATTEQMYGIMNA